MQGKYYVGIDMDGENAVVSYYRDGMTEPETISPVAGSELFQIPVLLEKKCGMGQWFIGADAGKIARLQGGEPIGRLMQRALSHDTVTVDGQEYPAGELFALYVKKLILLSSRLGNPELPTLLIVSLPALSREVTELFFGVAENLGMGAGRCMLIDRGESFYYFVYSQQKELWLHDVCLFDFDGEKMSCRVVGRNSATVPQTVVMTEREARPDGGDLDGWFCGVLEETFSGRICSSVYLSGSGFDGGWMRRSLDFMCRGRRAFVGKNLYSKGACYAAMARDRAVAWNFVYMGDNEMKVNVSLQVRNGGKTEFFTLINAGENWYEASGACDVILAGGKEVAFWLQPPNSREARVEKLELSDLPDRPEKTTRLSVSAKPLSDTEVRIVLKDEGFGEIARGSGRSWEYTMSL